VRRVLVDLGYGLAESWTIAKVVDSRMCKELFGDGEHESLLVEFADGERSWIDRWEEYA
jgi:hypothetical protein